jgi:hypothetical protein
MTWVMSVRHAEHIAISVRAADRTTYRYEAGFRGGVSVVMSIATRMLGCQRVPRLHGPTGCRREGFREIDQALRGRRVLAP